MPIKPENKRRYPSNWKEIRESILERAGHKCEKCNAVNHTRVCRGVGSDLDTFMTDDAQVYCADTGKYLGQYRMSDYNPGKMVDIVLTIAHLDHIPENSHPENLRAWCQRCHLRYDAKHHAETARITRRDRYAIGDLFSNLVST